MKATATSTRGTKVEPILLTSNQPQARFYKGGQRISEFRGEAASGPNTPEDWVASTTSVRGKTPVGMTRLADGTLLADAIAAAPEQWLGSRHVGKFGPDTMVLVKLLDAGQRLPIHAHPDGAFAREHIAAAHGKAEAWYILSPGTVHLGLTRDVPLAELQVMVAGQEADALLALMHEIPVEAGDCVFVPHGLLHAIGEGILLAEVQEPEDLSILLEWKGFDLDGEKDGHLGLGFELALAAIDTSGLTDGEVEGLIRREVTSGQALPDEADSYFRLDRTDGRRDFPADFAVIIALTDHTRLTVSSGFSLDLAAGSTVLMPYAAGTFRVDGEALIARPPKS